MAHLDLSADVVTLTQQLVDIFSVSHQEQEIADAVEEALAALPHLTVTRRGLLNATLPGQRTRPDRAIAVHADTIGCMVTRLKDNGRLEVTQLGTHSARFAEGAHVTIFTDDERVHTGTVLPLKSSGHQYGDEVDTQGVGWPLVEVRVDEPVSDAAGLSALPEPIGVTVAVQVATYRPRPV